jgi:hypothetical protein
VYNRKLTTLSVNLGLCYNSCPFFCSYLHGIVPPTLYCQLW